MLTPPAISPQTIIDYLGEVYGMRALQATFLPIGADVDAAVYRIHADDGARYFLKLKRGDFDDVAVAIPAFLHAHGLRQVMAPLATTARQLWVSGHGFHWLLYPFFEGQNGYEVALSAAQWRTLGECVNGLHALTLPAPLDARVPREDYSPQWRNMVNAFNRQVEKRAYGEPIAARLAAFWLTRRDDIRAMVARAERLSRTLRERPRTFVLCHADMHPGNILLGAHDELAIVDWDNPILAPKEHDLMCIGGGMGFAVEGAREDALFYHGYGSTAIDPVALAYYRYERIVADVAAYGEQIFGAHGSVEDREDGLRRLMGQFLPHQVVAIAHQTYEAYGRLT